MIPGGQPCSNPRVHLKADRLSKRFGWVTALDDLSWEVAPGQIVAVLGPNGAGKTTLLNALSGSIALDRGQVLMDGQRYGPSRGELRRRFAFIPDLPPAPAGWSPLRFIGTVLRLYGVPREGLVERVETCLHRLDLQEVVTWKFRQLSRGQAYKAVLAAFLTADPELWFLDEPFASGMDPRGLTALKDYGRQAATRGHTLIFTTQLIEVAERFAHRVCVLDHGRIQADGPPDRLAEDPALAALLRTGDATPRP